MKKYYGQLSHFLFSLYAVRLVSSFFTVDFTCFSMEVIFYTCDESSVRSSVVAEYLAVLRSL